MEETIIDRVLRTIYAKRVIRDHCPREFGYEDGDIRCHYNERNCDECWHRIIKKEE